MKRVIVFLLLFGIGFAVLWTQRTKPKTPEEGPDLRSNPATQGQFSDLPAPSAQGDGQNDAIQIKLAGPVDFTQRTSSGAGSTLTPELHVHANNVVQLEGDVLDMHGLTIEVFDPKTGKQRAEVRSPLSRVRIARDAGAPRLPDTEPIHLTDVVLTLLEGGPVVPLEFKTSKLDWLLADNSFSSKERVDVSGKGLTAHGTGLTAGAASSSFQLENDAEINLDLERDRKVTLKSSPQGRVSAQQIVTDGVEYIDVVADHGAKLTVSGVLPMTIVAQRIHMLGRKTGRTSDPFEVVSADADGSVVAESRGDKLASEHAVFTFAPGAKLAHATLDRNVELASSGDTFRADHAEFDFDAAGDLERSTLTGNPNGDVEVGRFLTTDRPELASARAKLSGQGPLVAFQKDGANVDMLGPATLEAPEVGLVLRASERIVGRDDPTTKTGRMEAIGDVQLDYKSSKLRSSALEMDWMLVAGVPTVLVKTKGETTLDATTADGRKATTIARGGLDGTATKLKQTITEARDVEITSPEQGGIVAKADFVRDFDPVARTFVAEGNVTFTNAQGQGGADRITAVSRDEVRFFGSDTQRAHYKLTRGASSRVPALTAHVQAVEIVARPDRVTATRRVTGSIDAQNVELDFTSEALELTASPENAANSGAPRTFRAHVEHDVTANILRGTDRALLTCGDLVVEGTFTTSEPPTVVVTKVHGQENVHVEYTGRGRIVGDGDEFTFDEAGLARILASSGKKVRAQGLLPVSNIPFAMEADWIEVDDEHFAAKNAKARLEPRAKPVDAAFSPAPIVAPERQGPGADPAVLREVRAQMMRAEKHEISLVGEAHVDGMTLDGEPWRLDAGSIRMRGDFSDVQKLETKQIASIDAAGGFHVVMGDRLEADGETLHAVPERVRVEGSPANMVLLDAEWQSPWIQYDTANMLLSTGQGSLRSRIGSKGVSWSIEYESMQPFDQDQKTILVLRNPRFRFGPNQLFAEWTLFWVDRDEWKKSGKKTLDESVRGSDLRVSSPLEEPVVDAAQEAAPEGAGPLLKLPELLSAVKSNPLFRVLSELYIEGNIEGFSHGERTARASAIYLDVVDTRGWIQNADISMEVRVRGLRQGLHARAKWMRIAPTPDGPSLRAENAEITSCEFEDPHYVIRTGDLRITPKKNARDTRVAYEFTTRKNQLRFESGLQIPLPPFSPDFDREGRPLIDRLVLGNSAKYGAAVTARVNAELGPVGKAAGRAIGTVLKIPDIDLKGNWHYNLGILGSRGVLAGVGIDLEATERFFLETDFDAIPDGGRDRGLVRVDKDDRSLLRTWFRARSRYTIRKGEWVDVAFSSQSDPGVQSEFFERAYLRYETKDNYVHWRKARNEWYFNSSVKLELENRRDVYELPSVGAFRGRTRIGDAFDNPIYYTGRLDAGYLQRRDGDTRYYQPFEDGLGDRNLLRIDTEHKFEVPFDLGVLAARGVPYVTARGTTWSEGADAEESPTRSALIVGFDATTTFWKRFSGGSAHTISPTIGAHTDVVSHDTGGDLILIDRTEDPIAGNFLDLGVRSRWWVPDTHERMDISVRATSGSNLPEGAPRGLLPIAVLADYLTYIKEMPIGLTHDARYDTQNGDTEYSLTSIGFEPWHDFGIELGYQRGLATDDRELLFESASIGARWRWTSKWEFEAEQSFPIADDTGVGHALTLRRLGHDFVMELELAQRSSEGSSFGIGFQPRITWRRSGLGLLDHWLGNYH